MVVKKEQTVQSIPCLRLLPSFTSLLLEKLEQNVRMFGFIKRLRCAPQNLSTGQELRFQKEMIEVEDAFMIFRGATQL